jgi:hypothetical protein
MAFVRLQVTERGGGSAGQVRRSAFRFGVIFAAEGLA